MSLIEKEQDILHDDNAEAQKTSQSSELKVIDDNDDVPLGTYRIRFFGLAVIVLLNIASSLNWLSFAPVPDYSASYYNVSLTVINTFSSAFIGTFIVFSWWTSWVFEKFGIRFGLAMGATFQVLGSWIRYFGTFAGDPSTKFAIAMLGQIMNGIAQPFVLNVPVHYAAVWFSDSGRATATMVGSIANPVGGAIAQIVIPMIVTDQSQIPFGLLTVAIITSVFSFLAYFVPQRPPTPPSYSAFVPSEPFIPGLKKLSRNVNFLILTFGFGVFAGLFNTLATILNQIVKPYGYSDNDAGILGAILVVAGLLGALVMGPVIDKTKKHVLIMKIVVPLVAVCCLALIFVVTFNNYAGIAVVCAILGFLIFSLLPVALEAGVESTYPVSESTSAAMLWSSAQAFALILIFSDSAMREPDNIGDPPGNMRKALIFHAILVVFTTVLVWFLRKDNRRLDFEKKEEERKHASSGRNGVNVAV